ncbi:hypothetical protein VTL71DRAFT_12402 [Oculimacula yallundae]|uniref:Polyketide synthase n=1 Tax=Oculimacula yallundae TaxID=86028 RepID=A0ABR4CMI1_9HELO
MQEPIAITGSACHFPGGADSPSKLWELLQNPRDVLTEFPEERVNLSRFYNKNGEHHGSTDVQNKSYFLARDPRLFDAAFFKINPLEAEGMDPLQRILLETVYEALESAGLTLDQMKGSLTSVYVGLMTADFYDIQMRDTEVLAQHTAVGTARSILSNRISYAYDLRGPSMTIDTACSSSLVALHQAVQSLRSGESTSSIVAGANLILDSGTYIAESKLHMLSPDSRSRMWDKDANGYARGEGFSALILKPLSAAIRDGDHIECLIRETGVNSDGRTKGITMPSATAQADLIRRTYRNAGLDPLVDRCQYFECHGTGTLAGDPVEARAVQETFFPAGSDIQPDFEGHTKLYVGSIKTIIGHLEGCAGLAGVLKASLAIQHKIIPANMHFNELNPAVAPFYDNLKLVTKAVSWPETVNNCKRASVNSFGFGGTNCHAILESYEPNIRGMLEDDTVPNVTEPIAGPLVFSANTESSLIASIKDFAIHIENNTAEDLKDLTYVLQSKRSALPFKTHVTGTTRDQILRALRSQVANIDSKNDSHIGIQVQPINANETPGILGIFTGQGAQWATMGRDLILSCPLFCQSIERCEEALSSLADGPVWSLKTELLAEAAISRLSEAALSQPLCTALQIALVDLVLAAGIKLDAVVGHSSGEIAATYAAGILSSEDAMRIAYYRGLHAYLAQGSNAEKGAMMAVALSFDDALLFCAADEFAGRLCVAASNSTTSITLSGDAEAIYQAKDIFDEDGTFARLLKVDTAYHSHHMLRCASAYLNSLHACNIQINASRESCVWISSVRGDIDLLEGNMEALKGEYWVQNMVKPVLFSQALECAMWNGGPFDIITELGPHPALKGPATQTFKSSLGPSPPYVSFLRRAENDIESFSDGVGMVWCHLGTSFVDFEGYRNAFQHRTRPKMLKDLPSYGWHHDKIHWKESRISRKYRLHKDKPQELLGRRVSDDSEFEMRWRNIFRLSEIPWLRGHQFQGQTIFPGAGYVSMALEASRAIWKGKSVKLIEIQDLVIPRAMVIEEESSGVETVFTIRRESPDTQAADNSILTAEFACYICVDERAGSLEKGCAGKLLIHLGTQFYSTISTLGLDYGGIFRTMKAARRSAGRATASACWTPNEINSRDYILHPALLDVGFQASFAAFASPATEALWAPYLPMGIRRILVNPNIGYDDASGNVDLSIDAFVINSSSTLLDVDIHMSGSSGIPNVQVEGLALKAISEPQASDDRLVFAETRWDTDVSAAIEDLVDDPLDTNRAREIELVDTMQRMALYYFQKLLREVKPEEVQGLKWYHQRLFEAIHALLIPISEGKNLTTKKEWLWDSGDTILDLASEFPDSIDLQMMRAVGENLVSVVRGETVLLEKMMENSMLDRLYVEGLEFRRLNGHVARLVQQITHKHPRSKILEIGAGTGGTTKSILDAIHNAYSSYTYTDITTGFLDRASEKFKQHRHKMIFKVLDVEKEVLDQGYSEHSYDIIIASNVLHATRTLSETMKHTRSLLRPGGYLIMMEVTGDMMQLKLTMGGLPGWWLGEEDGRRLGPGISPLQWDELLRETSFSGVDSIFYDVVDVSRHSCSLIVSQAIDDRIACLRDPLSLAEVLPTRNLLLIGGQTLAVAKLSKSVLKLLSARIGDVTVVDGLDKLDISQVASNTSVICLEELHSPVFEHITATRLKKLQELFIRGGDIVWVTKGRFSMSPVSNMTVGVGRALIKEMPHIKIQFIDFDSLTTASPDVIADSFARMSLLSSPEYRDHDMLWVTEPEIAINESTIRIPRIVQDTYRNERFNASRRPIVGAVSKLRSCVEIVTNGDRLSLLERGCDLTRTSLSTNTRIDVHFSVAFPSATKSYNYLCLGYIHNTHQAVFAFTQTNASTIDALPFNVFVPTETVLCEATTLLALSTQILVKAIQMSVPPNSSVLYYEPDERLAACLMAGSCLVAANTYFGAVTRTGLPNDWISIHPQLSANSIKQMLPRDLDFAVVFQGATSEMIISCLSTTTTTILADSIMGDLEAIHVTSEQLSEAYHKTIREVQISSVRTTAAQSVSEAPVSSMIYPHIIDWTSRDDFDILVQPLNLVGMFSATKTYFMVGMTGELGRSICDWMIKHGARNIVLTSRNADVDTTWIQEMHTQGAIVKVFKMDVSDKESLRSTVSAVRFTMPPIAGVCNAAMVLSDKLFIDTNIDLIEAQFRPKVDGTRNLNEIFSDDNLDFFVLFSSLAAITGNGGQSIYHAANMFMTSLAAQRKENGLAASVIHIGMVTDIGYIARQGRHLEDHLRSHLYRPLSETDIHHLFAEAVLAGNPSSSENSEIIMGIQPFLDSPDAKVKPPWYDNPRFSHLILDGDASERKVETGSIAAQARQKLDNATTEDDATSALVELFSLKLELLMQLGSNTVNVNLSLLDLGCDSLLAVEIRTWFLKEIHVDVPILKILSQDTAGQICGDTARKFLHLKLENEEILPEILPTMVAAIQTPEMAPVVISSGNTDCRLVNSEQCKVKLVKVYDGGSQTSESGSSQENTNTSSVSSKSVTVSPSGSASSRKRISQPSFPIIPVMNGTGQFIRDQFAKVERMSFAQSRLYFMHKYLADQTTYNVTLSYDIFGPLHAFMFERALVTVIARHEMLRTCFFAQPDSGEPMQGILSGSSFRLRHTELGTEEDVKRQFEDFCTHKWDLEKGSTFGAALISQDESHHTIIFGYHHIIMDGVSWHLFVNDLNLAYQLRALQPTPRPYTDFAAGQIRAADAGIFESQTAFWKGQHVDLPDVMPLLPFANAKARTVTEDYDSFTTTRFLSRDLVKRIKHESQALRVAPFHFHLTVLQALFSRLLEVDDLCIGVTDANRLEDDFDKTIGFFLNLLPLRFKLDRSDSFSTLAANTSQNTAAAFTNSQIPFDMILDKLNVPRHPTHSPLFQVAFNYRNGNLVKIPIGNCSMELAAVQDARTQYDMAFNVTQVPDGTCGIQLTYRGYLYSQEAADSVMGVYMNLLDRFCVDRFLRIQDVELFQANMGLEDLKVGRGPLIDFEWPPTLSEKFQLAQRRAGARVAVKDKSSEVSYAQLAERVNNVARRLTTLGTTPGSHIAVLCSPSISTVVCMLAILHIGCIYVPLDLSLPPVRHAAMLKSCNPGVLLVNTDTLGMVDDLKMNDDFMTVVDVTAIATSVETVKFSGGMKLPAFLLYTSGSTGKPKGIILSQEGFINYAASKSRRLGLLRETVMQQSSTGFDMSIAQMFNSLANEGTLIMVPQESRGDPVAISRLMLDEKITFTVATPSEYLMLLRYGSTDLKQHSAWRHACLGGEPVTPQLKRAFHALNLSSLVITDCYGPTEISAATTFETVLLQDPTNSEGTSSTLQSVGKSIYNSSIRILDGELNPVPNGLSGEICVSGPGVAIGYLDLEDLSHEKFISDPFATASDIEKGWSRLYCTGDRGRLLPDGRLVFLGRMEGDTQIKLRGLRIDLEGITSTLLQSADGLLSEVALVVRGDPEILVAYVVVSMRRTTGESDLRLLSHSLPLPQYMCPSRIIILESLPTTSNGKIDLLKLRELPLVAPNQELSSQKLSLCEGELRLLWQDIFHQVGGTVQVLPDSDFFMLGGNSLLLVKLQSSIKERIGILVPLSKLYQASMLRRMASVIGIAKMEQQVDELIDWDAETAIPEKTFLALNGLSSGKQIRRQGREILLTGSTTFLGSAILDALLADETVNKIHCIAVTADHTLQDGPKVVVYTGSLLDPSLGLSEEEYYRVQSSTDQIIHADSRGHCMNNYASLRTPNYLSTCFLAKLARPRNIPLHFVSSNRVTLLSGNDCYPPISIAPFLPTTDGLEGFTAAKWASEIYLENVYKETGLPVCIHRTCAVIGDDAPDEDAQNAILRYSILLRAVPLFENFEGYFDFKNVRDVAFEVATGPVAAGPPTFRHHSSGIKIPVSGLQERMEELYNHTFEVLPTEIWIQKATSLGIEPLIVSYMEAMIGSGQKMSFPFMGGSV